MLWAHKRHPIPHPNKLTLVYLLWIFQSKPQPISQMSSPLKFHFYPRPILASVCLSVCVYQSLVFVIKSKFTPLWACLHHNSSPVQARITKFGPKVQHNLVKIPNVLGCSWPWPSRSNSTSRSNFLFSPLPEIHNHHLTTREPWVSRLLHILCMYLYT